MSQNVRSLAFTVWKLVCFEDLEEKSDIVSLLNNQLISEGGVCRTAPATPGLLIPSYTEEGNSALDYYHPSSWECKLETSINFIYFGK